jgi:hypothetical protein
MSSLCCLTKSVIVYHTQYIHVKFELLKKSEVRKIFHSIFIDDRRQ